MGNISNIRFVEDWKDIREYRKKLWLETRVKWSVILITLYSFLGITYISSYILNNNITFLSSFLLYNVASIPHYVFFSYITWREWKEKKLLSGVFMVFLFFLFSFIYAAQTGYIFLRIPLILGLLLLYGLAPIGLIRIRLTKRKRDT